MFGREVFAQPAGAQLLGFMLKHKCSRWRKLAGEIILAEHKTNRLIAQRLVSLEVVDDCQPIVRAGQRRQCRISVRDLVLTNVIVNGKRRDERISR